MVLVEAMLRVVRWLSRMPANNHALFAFGTADTFAASIWRASSGMILRMGRSSTGIFWRNITMSVECASRTVSSSPQMAMTT